MMIDKHTLALISIIGSSLDVRSHLRRALGNRVRPWPWVGFWAHDRRGARSHTCLGVFPGFAGWTEDGILA
jgi:hypothetical protein